MAELFIAIDGDDKNPGTIDQPFATLNRAKQVVSSRRAKVAEPVTVYLRDGTHFLDEPFMLQPPDSGSALAPTTYAAYPSEKPVLSSGVRLTGWQSTRVNGLPVWVAQAPPWSFHQLWVGDMRRDRPRLPKHGLYRIKKTPASDNPYLGQKMFTAEPGAIGTWKNLGDADAVVMTAWVDSRMPIKSADAASGVVKCELRAALAMRTEGANPSRFYIDNVFEAFDEPGLWYHDKRLHKVYYLPFPGEDLSTVEVVVPRHKSVVTIQGNVDNADYVEYIRFQGITFAHSEWWRTPAAKI